MHPFNALADPKRRTILELLGKNRRMSATQIYAEFNVSDSAISQHLKVLKKSDLIIVEKQAQQRIYQLNPKTVYEMRDWIQQLTVRLEEQFDALDKVLEEEKAKQKKKSKGSDQKHGQK